MLGRTVEGEGAIVGERMREKEGEKGRRWKAGIEERWRG